MSDHLQGCRSGPQKVGLESIVSQLFGQKHRPATILLQSQFDRFDGKPKTIRRNDFRQYDLVRPSPTSQTSLGRKSYFHQRIKPISSLMGRKVVIRLLSVFLSCHQSSYNEKKSSLFQQGHFYNPKGWRPTPSVAVA